MIKKSLRKKKKKKKIIIIIITKIKHDDAGETYEARLLGAFILIIIVEVIITT
jgi:hypothetical protein